MLRALTWLVADRLNIDHGKRCERAQCAGEKVLEQLLAQLEQEEQEHGGSAGG